MLNIESILMHVLQGITAKDPRFQVISDEHVLDTKTGVTIHVYDDWFKLTREDENVITKNDFTDAEQNVVWQIKQVITPPEVLKEKEVNYKPLQDHRRAQLSYLYEQPTPIPDVNNVQPEPDTTEYTG